MLEQKYNPQQGSGIPVADLEKTRIDSLRASLQGELLQVGDDAYDSAVGSGMA
jgi:hypothetical protein